MKCVVKILMAVAWFPFGMAWSQALTSVPEPIAAYASTDGATWNPLTSAATYGALGINPPPRGLYCQASQGAAWTPCLFGGGGSGTVSPNSSGNAGSPAVYGTGTGSSVQAAPNSCVETSTGENNCPQGQTTPNIATFTTLNTTSTAASSVLLGNATTNASDSVLVVRDATNAKHTAELQASAGYPARTALTFSTSAASAMFEFGTDSALNGTKNYYVYDYATGQFVILTGANDAVTFPNSVAATVIRSGVASNTDMTGNVTLAAGSTSSPVITFTGAYAISPVCVFFPQNASAVTVAAMGAVATQVSTTQTSVNVQTAPAVAVTFGYSCVGRS